MTEPPETISRLRPGRIELTCLALIVLGSAVARFLDLGALPLGAAGSEEGTSWLVTAGQLRHWYPLLPSGLAYWKGWPYTFLAALVSALFGLSPWSLRVPSAVAGTLSVPLAWWASRGLLARLQVTAWPAAVASLFAAYLLGFSQWCLLMSRWGRFYTMGQTLFLAGVGIAAIGFSAPGKPARKSMAAFGAVLFVAVATFHPGGLLLFALPVALALGIRFDRRQAMVLFASLAACALWFAGVLFLWKSGHVNASSGWKDLLLVVGFSFWKHMVLLLTVGFTAWVLIVRGGRSRRSGAGVLLAVLILLETVILVAAGLEGVNTGALRGFATLAQGHPGLMILSFVGTMALLFAAWRLPIESGRAAGLVWFLTVIPIALVGASTGNFVPRYLLFTFGPLAVTSAVGLGLLIAWIPFSAWRLAGAALALPLALWLVAPAVGVAGSIRMIFTRVGDAWPPLYACSPTRAYALDLETPSRFVTARLSDEDLVVSTARSIPEAIIGRMDYFFRVPNPGNAAYDETGGPFNILTGCPVLSRPEQVLELCGTKRVFIILDERALHLKEVRDLKERLLQTVGQPAYTDGKYAEVYILPRGCGG